MCRSKERRKVNTRLKKMIKELSDAINGSLAESEQIARAIASLKEEGYDIFLVLEATIGFNHRNDEHASSSAELVASRTGGARPEFRVNANDVRFLKALRISVDDNR